MSCYQFHVSNRSYSFSAKFTLSVALNLAYIIYLAHKGHRTQNHSHTCNCLFQDTVHTSVENMYTKQFPCKHTRTFP